MGARTNKKTIVFSKQIHSCFASFSSGDELLKIVTDSKEIDFQLELNGRIKSEKFPALNGEKIKYIEGDSKYVGISLESNKRFYNVTLHNGLEHYNKTPQFIELVQSYIDKGFKKDIDISEQTAYFERVENKERVASKKRGVVLWMGYDAHQGHPEYFQGGFSDEVFNSKELKSYIKDGRGVFGWIGHYQGRTFYGDKLIEAGLRKRGISPSRMYNYLSSSSGRHFADSIEYCTKAEQKEQIEQNLNSMYNSCILYGCPTHGGTASSTHFLQNMFNEFGILLTHDVKYNHKKHIDNIMKSKKQVTQHLSTHLTVTDEMKYIEEVINEIFANKV